jgi:alkaline phosphatase
MNALHNKAYSIEADVYLRNGGLVVAHDKKDIVTAPSLDSLYLKPIIRLFKKHHGRISKSKTYAPVLMIDVKENSEAVIAALIQLLAQHRSVFDRTNNPMAIQLIISGDRGAVSKWNSYSSFIFFDGRPYELYDSAALQRVAFISNNYSNYVTASDSTSRIQQVVTKVHGMGKLLRLWAIPDNPASWRRLQQLGVDIINTDKVGECREYFSTK